VLRIGLTGGIASGKTTVARLFADRGVPIIDADAIAHRISEPGQDGYRAIVDQFGEAILDGQGKIDRARLRDEVFRNAGTRQRLEAALHPLIRAEMDRQEQGMKAPYCVLVIPLLVETGMQRQFDRVLVVEAERNLRQRWLCERDGIDAAAAGRIMAAQADDASRRAVADDLLVNDGDPGRLEAEVDALHKRYLQLAG